MSDPDAHQTYIITLREKYRSACRDEDDALESLQSARKRKEIYAATLEAEGVPIHEAAERALERVAIKFSHRSIQTPLLPPESSNGHSETPLSDTHAVYIAIRKHGNTGITFDEIAKLSTQNGYSLTAERAKKVFWKQSADKRMTKEGEKVFLTKEGESFNKFRVQKYAK